MAIIQTVFVHGLGQKVSSWDKVIRLMDSPNEAVCPDLIALMDGKEITYQNLYRAFSGYCGKLSTPMNLCGLSLGGVLALNYAIDNPGRVKSLVLIAAQYKMPKTLLGLQNIVFKLLPQSVFSKMGFPKKDVIVLTKSMATLDFSEKLGVISCPVLVACGAKDKANMKASRNLNSMIWGASLSVIENAGHEVNLDAPDRLAAQLNMFYKNK